MHDPLNWSFNTSPGSHEFHVMCQGRRTGVCLTRRADGHWDITGVDRILAVYPHPFETLGKAMAAIIIDHDSREPLRQSAYAENDQVVPGAS